jgi:hypothetical protein
VGFLRGHIKIIQHHQQKDLKARVFEKIVLHSKNVPTPSEPLTEEEAAQFKIISSNPAHCKELVELIE